MLLLLLAVVAAVQSLDISDLRGSVDRAHGHAANNDWALEGHIDMEDTWDIDGRVEADAHIAVRNMASEVLFADMHTHDRAEVVGDL